MSKKRRNNTLDVGAPLPLVINTDKRMCVCLCIPDEPEYRQAFRGQLASLGKWFFWEKGTPGDTRAKEAAQLWRTLLYEDLEMPCGCGDDEKLFRFDENGNLESSTDGGITWQLDPAADPRLTAPQSPLLPGADGSSKRCEAANNVTSHIKAKADDLIGDSAAWGNISGLLAGIGGLLIFLSIVGTGGALTPISLGIAGSLLGLGSAAFAAAMTEAVYEDLNCFLYCEVSPDGTFSAAAVGAIQARINDNMTGAAHKFLHDTVGLMGSKGLTNMAATDGIASTFECDDCDCNIACVGEGAVIMGTIVDQTEEYITLQGEFGTWNGIEGWYAIYGSMENNYCCLMCSWQVLAGGLSAGSLLDCNGNGSNGLPDLKRRAEFRGTDATFVIKFTFDTLGDGCP